MYIVPSVSVVVPPFARLVRLAHLVHSVVQRDPKSRNLGPLHANGSLRVGQLSPQRRVIPLHPGQVLISLRDLGAERLAVLLGALKLVGDVVALRVRGRDLARQPG